MQYILYTIDTMFLDGLNDFDNDEVSILSNAPSMQLSADRGMQHEDDDAVTMASAETMDSLVDKEFDAVSEVSIQTIDLDYMNVQNNVFFSFSYSLSYLV